MFTRIEVSRLRTRPRFREPPELGLVISKFRLFGNSTLKKFSPLLASPLDRIEILAYSIALPSLVFFPLVEYRNANYTLPVICGLVIWFVVTLSKLLRGSKPLDFRFYKWAF